MQRLSAGGQLNATTMPTETSHSNFNDFAAPTRHYILIDVIVYLNMIQVLHVTHKILKYNEYIDKSLVRNISSSKQFLLFIPVTVDSAAKF